MYCYSKLNIVVFCVWNCVINCDGSFSFNLSGINAKSINNFVCHSNDVVRTKYNIMSELHCVYSCALNGNCESIFFHQANGTCVMCKASYVDTTKLHVYPGTTYLRSKALTCAEWSSYNGVVSGTFTAEVDPDGFDPQFGWITVPCDLDSEPGKAITVLNHDKEARTRVKGYYDCYSYRVTLTYTLGFEAVMNIVDASSTCKQFVKYECRSSGCMAWENRHQEWSSYFTGNGSSTYACDCEPSGTCSTTSGCQCQRNDATWRFDSGNVTNKEHLPITAFGAGDTDASGEEGYHTIGPLLCW